MFFQLRDEDDLLSQRNGYFILFENDIFLGLNQEREK